MFLASMSIGDSAEGISGCTMLGMTLKANGRWAVEHPIRGEQIDVTDRCGFDDKAEAEELAKGIQGARVYDREERQRQRQVIQEQAAKEEAIIEENSPEVDRLLDERYASVTDEELAHHGTWKQQP